MQIRLIDVSIRDFQVNFMRIVHSTLPDFGRNALPDLGQGQGQGRGQVNMQSHGQGQGQARQGAMQSMDYRNVCSCSFVCYRLLLTLIGLKL